MGSTSGRHRPTIEGVARLTGVTTGAVSIALNGLAGVADATRARIGEAARTLSWRPSQTTRALFTGQGGALATRQLLECRARSTAIACANDLIDISGMSVAIDAGLARASTRARPVH